MMEEIHTEQKESNNSGALIFEATIVFPVVFLVIFIMMVLGNAYWQRSKIDQLVAKEAIKGAAYCGSPLLQQYESNGRIPGLIEADVKPYRYFLSGYGDSVANDINGTVSKYISSMSTGLFTNMKPQKIGDVKVEFNNMLVYSTFSVEAMYKIIIPVRIIGMSDWFSITFSSRSEIAVSDTSEFIRNVDMTIDYAQQLGIDKILAEFKNKLSNALEKVKSWFR